MAWHKTGWTDLVGTSSVYSVLAAAASTAGSMSVLNGASSYVVMDTMVKYAASTAASYLALEWFGVNHTSASLSDTISIFSVNMTGTNGASVKGTYSLNVSGKDGVRVKVKNFEDTDTACVHIAAMFGYP